MHKPPQFFAIENFTEYRIQMLNWANRFNIFCLLDNQHYQFETPAFECLLAAGTRRLLRMPAGKAFDALKAFSDEKEQGWLFGHFAYDLKNETEALQSSNRDGIGCDDLFFFEPEVVIRLTGEGVFIYTDNDVTQVFDEIAACSKMLPQATNVAVNIRHRIAPEKYIETVTQLQQHIARGDCYEINFCQEFYDDNAVIDPLYTYEKLAALSPNPFSALYKMNDRWCLCASPERYLKKTGNQLISQPIKGTAKRNLLDKALDEMQKRSLLESEKEKSENVMVVDLVRNDLSKVCTEGSVQVEELFGIYSFPQVHQMISTVSGEVSPGMHWVDMIRHTFPMGSMTGVPKKRVMELIEYYEQTKRGLFSGAIGYREPGGDFDFNVVIRSILYNQEDSYLSFQSGGAITFHSDPQKEYEESLLKASAMKQVLA